MNTTKELKCIYNNNKSFYGKAEVKQEDNDVTLISYGIEIVNVYNGKITPLWDGWSATTNRHLKEFFKQFWDVEYSKKAWDKIQAGEIKTIKELRNM